MKVVKMVDLWLVILLTKLALECYVSPFELSSFPRKWEFVQIQNEVRVMAGEEADIEDHPYQVFFEVDSMYSSKFACGGFIISENYIVTAGHCARDVDPSTVVLRAGSSYAGDGIIIPIAEVFAHPQFNNPQFDKDVGVIKTVDPIPLNNETIMAIPLPPMARPMRGETQIIVSGWGWTENGMPDHLMQAELPVVPFEWCTVVYATLTNNEFCAGYFLLGGPASCSGDSGGAAVQDGMAVGIVSYGRGCGLPLSPSVFADIAAPEIRNFIKEHTGL